MALRPACRERVMGFGQVFQLRERPRCRMLVDFVVPERWYAVDETAKVLGFSRDTVIRLIKSGELEAMTLPTKPRRPKRVYSSRRIQGAEIIRFVRKYTRVAA